MPLAWGGGIFGGGGGGAGNAGTGAAGRVGVWTGPGTIGGYAGFTFDSATNKATLLGGLIDSALTAGRVVIVGTGGQIQDDAGLTYSGTGTGTVLRIGSTGTGLSEISAGEVGVGTGAAGSIDGTVSAGTLSARGSAASPKTWIQAGIPGTAYFAVGEFSPGGIRVASLVPLVIGYTAPIAWTPDGDPFGTTPDLTLTRRAAATLQLGAADAAQASTVAQTLAVQGSRAGTDSDAIGKPFIIQSSIGTGVGGGGDLSLRTAPKNASGGTATVANTPTDRIILAGKQVTLTESSATPILDVAVPSGTVAGGEVLYTIRADDATDFQALTGRVQWSAVNKGGTLTAAINLVGTETTAVSSGTLTNTATISTGTNLITINLNAVSSLTQTTLYAYVQAQNNGTGNSTTK